MPKPRFIKKEKPVARNCPFCKKGSNPDYKEFEFLKTYMTERGKIQGKDRTGLCSSHQRKITTEIKRARFLALLPFSTRIR